MREGEDRGVDAEERPDEADTRFKDAFRSDGDADECEVPQSDGGEGPGQRHGRRRTSERRGSSEHAEDGRGEVPERDRRQSVDVLPNRRLVRREQRQAEGGEEAQALAGDGSGWPDVALHVLAAVLVLT